MIIHFYISARDIAELRVTFSPFSNNILNGCIKSRNSHPEVFLTILTGKNCALLNSVQEWLLFHMFTQLIGVKIDSKNECLLLSASFTGKIWVDFCINTGKHFFLEVLF